MLPLRTLRKLLLNQLRLMRRPALRTRARRATLVVGLACGVLVPTVWGQLPRATLSAIFPLGAQRGQSVEVELTGSHLDLAQELVFSHPGIKAVSVTRAAQEFEQEPQVVPNRFVVTVSADVPPAIYEVRAISSFGVSNSRAFVVGDGGELVEQGDHESAEKAQEIALGQTCNARCEPARFDWYRFSLNEQQVVTFQCLATELDSDARPVLTVYDPRGQQIVRSKSLQAAQATIQAGVAGEYRVSVHDHTFAGGGQYGYRLSLIPGVVPTTVYPPLVAGLHDRPDQLDAAQKLSLRGWAAEPLMVGRRESRVARWIAEPTASSDSAATVLDPSPALAGWAGHLAFLPTPAAAVRHGAWDRSLPLWSLPTGRQLVVEPDDDPPQLSKLSAGKAESRDVTVPAVIAGRLFPHGDLDWWEFTANAGDVYWLEVACHRLGMAAQPRLIVQRAQGDAWQTLAVEEQYRIGGDRNEGRPIDPNSRDPRFRLACEAAGKFRVGILDVFNESRDDPGNVYWIDIRSPQPTFRLAAWCLDPHPNNERQFELQSPVFRRGESLVVQVAVDRVDGFTRPITLQVEGLPENWTASPVSVASQQAYAQLVIQAPAEGAAWRGPVQIVGTAAAESAGPATATEERQVARVLTAVQPVADLGRGRPNTRLSDQLWLSLMDESMPLSIQVAQPAVSTSIGGKVTIPLTVRRSELFPGAVDLQPIGLPEGIQADVVKLADNSQQGELVVQVKKADLPPGDYAFHLQGKIQFKYARNSPLLKLAQAEKTRADEVIAQLKQEITDTESAVAQAAAGSPELAALQQKLMSAKERLPRAEAWAKQNSDRLEQLNKENEPRDVPVWVKSGGLQLTVHRSPVLVTTSGGEAPASGEVPLAVTIERRFGFQGPVRLELQAQAGQPSLTAPAVDVPADQCQAEIRIARPTDLTPGEYTADLVVKLKSNDVDVQDVVPVTIRVPAQ